LRFIIGLLVGLVTGATAAVVYSIQTGRGYREAFEQLRAELDERDIEVLGARLDARFTELQSRLEAGIGMARERAAAAIDQAADLGHAQADRAVDTASSEMAVPSEDATQPEEERPA
jgi:gas vesicle protein